MPSQEKEDELARLADQINRADAEIEGLSQEFVLRGTELVKRAIACGAWFRAVKAVVGHGNFEGWCEQNLQCKLRKTQYYMLLAKRHAETDIVSLNPQSLRQALVYAGALMVKPVERVEAQAFATGARSCL